MSKINECFEPVSETDRRQKCKVVGCTFVSKDTSSSTGYKWKHFRSKHPNHPILEHDPQKLKRKAEDDSNVTPSKQPKVRLELNLIDFLVLDFSFCHEASN